MSGRLRLVPAAISHDTVEASYRLMTDASEGKLIGLAFIGIYRGRQYIVDAAGVCYEQPALALGPWVMLGDYLKRRELGE